MTMVTRFAPSPTGPLHLGHAYSALLAHDRARAAGGSFLLRIDDLDQSRARPEWEAQIYHDLQWLGLSWPEPCRRESDCTAEYEAALDQLWSRGLLYRCTCTRRDIAEALSAPQEGAPVHGPDGLIYPGTCRWRHPEERNAPLNHPRPRGVTLRLDMEMATAQIAPDTLHDAPIASFEETGAGPDGQTGRIDITAQDMIGGVGDVVLARRDMAASYHLAVVVDDAAQHVTEVTRGADLFDATRIHVLLQQLLSLQTPSYHHHRLIRDDNGKRLAKRDDARAIAKYRDDGATPVDIRRMVGL